MESVKENRFSNKNLNSKFDINETGFIKKENGGKMSSKLSLKYERVMAVLCCMCYFF